MKKQTEDTNKNNNNSNNSGIAIKKDQKGKVGLGVRALVH